MRTSAFQLWGVGALAIPLLAASFSVDASERIEAEDRDGVERLVRLPCRPPFALERLHALDSRPSSESRLLYRGPNPDIHGRTALLLTPRTHAEPGSDPSPPQSRRPGSQGHALNRRVGAGMLSGQVRTPAGHDVEAWGREPFCYRRVTRGTALRDEAEPDAREH